MSLIKLKVNSQLYYLDVEPQETLQQVLRNKLHIQISETNCENGVCGNCTVLLNGVPRQVCKIKATEASNSVIVTMLPEMANTSYLEMVYESTGVSNMMF